MATIPEAIRMIKQERWFAFDVNTGELNPSTGYLTTQDESTNRIVTIEDDSDIEGAITKYIYDYIAEVANLELYFFGILSTNKLYLSIRRKSNALPPLLSDTFCCSNRSILHFDIEAYKQWKEDDYNEMAREDKQ